MFFVTCIHAVDGPPHFSIYNEHGVNLISGQLSETIEDLSIGSGPLALTHSVMSFDGTFISFLDNFTGSYLNPNEYMKDHSVSLGAFSDLFISTAPWPKKSGNMSGGYLYSPSTMEKVFIMGDGTKVYYNAEVFNGVGPIPVSAFSSDGNIATATKVVFPTGHEISIFFSERPNPHLPNKMSHRIQSVVSSSGYHLKYHYVTDDPNGNFTNWRRPYKITAINGSYEYCDPNAFGCNLSLDWPEVNYEWPVIDSDGLSSTQRDFVITFPDGSKSRYKHSLFCATSHGTSECSPKINNNARISSIIHSTSRSQITQAFEYGNKSQCSAYVGMEVNCQYAQRSIVIKSKVGDSEISYSSSFPRFKYIPMGITADRGSSRLSVSVSLLDPNKINPTFLSDTQKGMRVHLIANGSKVSKLVYTQTGAEAGFRQTEFDYDDNGNITERRDIAKDNSLPDLVSRAGYENHCNNDKTRNKPTWTMDANGHQTDYTYHCQSGQVATVTYPADRNGIRPQRRYFYEQKYAWVKTAGGGYTRAASPIWMLTTERYCRTTAANGSSCSNPADEVVIRYDYGPNSGPNNLLVRGKTTTADGQSLTACYDYDRFGNLIAETPPRANVSSCY